MAPRILLLTTEPLPIAGLPATGAGMRAWALAEGLRSAGFDDLQIAFAADASRGVEIALPGHVQKFERAALDDFIAEQSPDIVLFQHWGLFDSIKREIECPVAMDLAGPHLLERRLWNSLRPAEDLAQKLRALARADFVVCSGQFQRHWFLPFLVQAGHEPTPTLCPVIPFSMSPNTPPPEADRIRDRFLFAGMFLPWQDPEATLRTTLEVMDDKDRGSLLFIGGPHPAGDVSGGRFDSLLEFLKQHPRVTMEGTMSFDELSTRMANCGAAIDLMPRNAERELAFPTRTVTFLWAGLPVIHNDYDELAGPIDREKAGWIQSPDDLAGLRQRIGRLVSHHEDIDPRSANAQELVRREYNWEKTITPLADWCADPKPRAGRGELLMPVQADVKSEATASAKRTLGTVTYSPPSAVTETERGPWYLSPVVFALALPVSVALVLLFALAELVRLVIAPSPKRRRRSS